MSPADRLRAQARELLRIADQLDRAPTTPAPGRDRYFLDTGRALAICHRSHTWLYTNGRKFGFGWQLPSGSWAFSEPQLRAFLAGHTPACEESEFAQENDAATLSVSPKSRHGEKSA